jgi:hypothetical protein
MVTTVENTDKGVWDMHDYSVEEHGDIGRLRHGSQTFYLLLQEMAEIHDKKSHDYASDSDPSGNYHFAGQMAVLFSHSPQDAGFIGRFAEKLYRIKNLESSGKVGVTEAIEDTERDIATIIALWIADRRDRRRKKLEAVQKVREQMNRGEWSGIVPERPVDLTQEQQKDLIIQLFPLINKLSNLNIQQTIDYMSRLLSDRRTEHGKEESKPSGLDGAELRKDAQRHSASERNRAPDIERR